MSPEWDDSDKRAEGAAFAQQIQRFPSSRVIRERLCTITMAHRNRRYMHTDARVEPDPLNGMQGIHAPKSHGATEPQSHRARELRRIGVRCASRAFAYGHQRYRYSLVRWPMQPLRFTVKPEIAKLIIALSEPKRLPRLTRIMNRSSESDERTRISLKWRRKEMLRFGFRPGPVPRRVSDDLQRTFDALRLRQRGATPP